MNIYNIGSLPLIALALLYTRIVYGYDRPESKPEPTDRPPTIGSNEFYRNQEKEAVPLKPPLSYSSLDNERFAFFGYSLSSDDKNLLVNPNKMEHVIFNDKLLTFDDEAKLPSYPISSLTMYTCKESNIPILIGLIVSQESYDSYYYYKQDPNTQKWANCKMASLRESQKVNDYGLIYYRFKKSEEISTFYSYLAEACSEIPEKSGDIEGDFEEARELEEPTLEIILGDKDSDISSIPSIEDTLDMNKEADSYDTEITSLWEPRFPPSSSNGGGLSGLSTGTSDRGEVYPEEREGEIFSPNLPEGGTSNNEPDEYELEEPTLKSEEPKSDDHIPETQESKAESHEEHNPEERNSLNPVDDKEDEFNGIIEIQFKEEPSVENLSGQDNTVTPKEHGPDNKAQAHRQEGSKARAKTKVYPEEQNANLRSKPKPSTNISIMRGEQGQKITKIKAQYRTQYKPEHMPYDYSNLGCCGRMKKYFDDRFPSDYSEKMVNEVFFDKFGFSGEERAIPNYPNKLKEIKFNGAVSLEFDPKAKLPSYDIVYVMVFTCKHNFPVLVDLIGRIEHTYYAPSGKTKLWRNENMKELNSSCGSDKVACLRRVLFLRGIDHVDDNGVKYYGFEGIDLHHIWNKGVYKKWRSLKRRLCRSHKSEENRINTPTLEFTVEIFKSASSD